MIGVLAAVCLAPTLRPNIVLIFSDDHARQAISAYGSKLAKTPGIDRLAREGTRFDRHYTANPICAPSRASLLTGKHSHKNGHRDNLATFNGEQQTFPKLLQQGGYTTAVIGKWHLVSDPTGFDHWKVLPGQGAYYNPVFITKEGRRQESGYVSELITQDALAWLRAQSEKPFFLLMGHKAPHRNWNPGPNELPTFAGTRFPEPPTLRTSYDSLVSATKTVRMRIDRDMRPAEDLMVDFTPPALSDAQTLPWQATFEKEDLEYHAQLAASGDLLGTNYQRYLRNYLRSAAAVDKSVAQVMDYLETSGRLKNTIVVYASDQGFFLGENGWYDKRWFYEPSAGTPLLVRHPSGKKGKVVKDLTSNVDLAPTLLEWAGVPVPEDMQGKSFAGVSAGRRPAPRTSAYGHFYESDDPDHKAPKYVALVTATHKIIHYYELGETELFDLKRDPNETRNLFRDARSTAVRRKLKAELIAEMKRLDENPEVIAKVASLPD